MKSFQPTGSRAKSEGQDFIETLSPRAFQRYIIRLYRSVIYRSAFQWMCKLLESRATRMCIRVHVMGATVPDPCVKSFVTSKF